MNPLEIVLDTIIRSKTATGGHAPAFVVMSKALFVWLLDSLNMPQVPIKVGTFQDRILGVPFRVQDSGTDVWCASVDAPVI